MRPPLAVPARQSTDSPLAAFRRLQSKTQVLGVGYGDFHRTRLTHSIEVSQIGQGIAAYPFEARRDCIRLGLNDHLIEALCLAHDIGHPPFGHGGEIALHYKMAEYGGFEGNAQTFRIVTHLEPYSKAHGMNLSRRSIPGLTKYPNTSIVSIMILFAGSLPKMVTLKHLSGIPRKGCMTMINPLLTGYLIRSHRMTEYCFHRLIH